MVFLIQNTQNRDARAIHLKLDELLRAMKGARTAMVALENSTDEELAQSSIGCIDGSRAGRLHVRVRGRHLCHNKRQSPREVRHG
jgi:low affinity Fe/Cu permease